VGYCASFSTFQKDLQDLRSAAKFEVKLWESVSGISEGMKELGF
jgi:hypothetical protein